ncbi:unnamed protein product [Schistocephalus solidus]|uniref:DHC_N1 domain-containing protein n=1 Tax=Schistocephalus solidus TaxID=70667 RepID=A0A183T8M2_SCHSO|nr:unnamed protein product [Schistocephalus solidus]
MALPFCVIRARCGGTLPSQCGLYCPPTPWDPSQVWWYAQGRIRPRQPPASSPASDLLDSVIIPGSGGGGEECVNNKITDAANEAKTNVRFLTNLDKFLGPLAKSGPIQLTEQVPGLINAIRMIYEISQYYNTSERMTSLLVKVTNQMIASCRKFIYQGVSRIWDLPRPELSRRIEACIQLNATYQHCFRKVKAKLKENPDHPQFEFSENYIFGKFDTFCNRLKKIEDLVTMVEDYAPLLKMRIENLEAVAATYKGMQDKMKKRTYDPTDQSSKEASRQLRFLSYFEGLKSTRIDLMGKYALILKTFSRELEHTRNIYERQKEDPPIERNLTPVAGKIHWARLLIQRIQEPIEELHKRCPLILRTPEGQLQVRAYNQLARVLAEFEALYYRDWYDRVQKLEGGMNVPLLIRNPETGRFHVNLDFGVITVIQDAKHIRALGLPIPDSTMRLLIMEREMKLFFGSLHELLVDYERVKASIPVLLQRVLQPFRQKFEKTLYPGLLIHNWNSLLLNQFLKLATEELENFSQMTKKVSDIFECRIEDVFDQMSNTSLCDLPEEDTVTVDEFVEITHTTVVKAKIQLNRQSQSVETAVYDMVGTLTESLPEAEKTALSPRLGFVCTAGKKQRCQECLSCAYNAMIYQISQRNTDALITCTRLTLQMLRNRLQSSMSVFAPDKETGKRAAVFALDLVLEIPNVVVRPSLEDVQSAVSKAVQVILMMGDGIHTWRYMRQQQLKVQMQEMASMSQPARAQERILSANHVPSIQAKSLQKVIMEHKAVLKQVVSLNSSISVFQTDVEAVQNSFSPFSELWTSDPVKTVEQFMSGNPIVSDISDQIKHFSDLEAAVSGLPSQYQVGPLLLKVQELRGGLTAECQNWRQAIGRAVNKECAVEMQELVTRMDGLMKRLLRPVKDLDDIRSQMAALVEFRESEVNIEMSIKPIEEAYALLNRQTS